MSDDEDKTFEIEEHSDADRESSSDETRACLCSQDRRQCLLHRSCPNQSRVWDYFRKTKRRTGICRLCGKCLSCRSTITNLKMHLKRKHPVTYGEMTGEFDRPGETSDRVLLLQEDSGKAEATPRAGALWRWFKAGGGGRARCRVCGQTVRQTGDGLRTHLRRQHQTHYRKLQQLEHRMSEVDETATKCDPIVETGPEDGVGGRSSWVVGLGDSITEDPCSCGSGEQGAGSGGHKPGCSRTLLSSWDYYDKITLESAVCRLCEKTVSWQSDVDDLRRHLAGEHPTVTLQDRDGETEPPETHRVLIDETYLDEDMLREDEGPTTVRDIRDGGAEWDASLDRFGLYVASLMRMLPRSQAAKFQVQIIDRLIKERMKHERHAH